MLHAPSKVLAIALLLAGCTIQQPPQDPGLAAHIDANTTALDALIARLDRPAPAQPQAKAKKLVCRGKQVVEVEDTQKGDVVAQTEKCAPPDDEAACARVGKDLVALSTWGARCAAGKL